MVYDSRPKVSFREKSRDGFVWCLQSCCHCLPEPRHQVQKLGHSEFDWTVREGFPNRVRLCRASCLGCVGYSCRIRSTLVALAFATHSWADFLMPSRSSHSVVFAWLHVVTCLLCSSQLTSHLTTLLCSYFRFYFAFSFWICDHDFVVLLLSPLQHNASCECILLLHLC